MDHLFDVQSNIHQEILLELLFEKNTLIASLLFIEKDADSLRRKSISDICVAVYFSL